MKVGDLVKLKDGVHEDGIPSHRMAVIVSIPSRDSSDNYELMFVGFEKTYVFNEYFIVPIQKVD